MANYISGSKNSNQDFSGIVIGKISNENTDKDGVYCVKNGHIIFEINEFGEFLIGKKGDIQISIDEDNDISLKNKGKKVLSLKTLINLIPLNNIQNNEQ